MTDNQLCNTYIARNTAAGNNQSLRSSLLNECLMGQSKQFIFDSMNYFGETFAFDFEHCYICLTGLKKSVYTSIFQKKVGAYLKIYLEIEKRVCHILIEAGYRGEIFLLYYNNEKQIVIIFSPKGEPAVSVYVNRIDDKDRDIERRPGMSWD